mmetsp:Transcript_28669/g.48121  ORF Transcript_28669/g.48121 Transcript_28669/m.48121 type:complete len:117 (-) Transcript_28669:1939-2289(-)
MFCEEKHFKKRYSSSRLPDFHSTRPVVLQQQQHNSTCVNLRLRTSENITGTSTNICSTRSSTGTQAGGSSGTCRRYCNVRGSVGAPLPVLHAQSSSVGSSRFLVVNVVLGGGVRVG